jgi:DNA-directed RNA polymerase subunit RPC12/RpoP
MKANEATTSASSCPRLVCPECGHDRRFIQVMSEEAHLVDGNFNYIRLIEGIVDHYVCRECGASFKAEGHGNP